MSHDYRGDAPHRNHHSYPHRRPMQNHARGSETQYSKAFVFESNGPQGKLRGTSVQVMEKYLTLAREAQREGDTVLTHSFLQYAEHYRRILAEQTAHGARVLAAAAPRTPPQASTPSPVKAFSSEGSSGGTEASEEGAKNKSQDTVSPEAPEAGPRFVPSKRPRILRAPRRPKTPEDGPQGADASPAYTENVTGG